GDVARARVRGGQLLARIGPVEEGHVHHLLALQIGDTQVLARGQRAGESLLGRDHVREHRAHGTQSSRALRWPPSTVMRAPFMKLARSDATNTTTLATSSGVQIRPRGMLRTARLLASSGVILRARAMPATSPSQRSVATG